MNTKIIFETKQTQNERKEGGKKTFNYKQNAKPNITEHFVLSLFSNGFSLLQVRRFIF